MARIGLKKPLVCRLGFHKWQNYGDQVEVFWREPSLIKGGVKRGIDTSVGVRRGGLGIHSRVVFEGRECKRCGLKLRRRLLTNSDGTFSCVDWEPDTKRGT